MYRLGTASLGSMIRGLRSHVGAPVPLTGSLCLGTLGSAVGSNMIGSSMTGLGMVGLSRTITHSALGSQAAARSLTTRAGSAPGMSYPGIFTRTGSTGSQPQNSYISAPHTVRPFSSTSALSHNHLHKPKEGEELHVTFISKDGSQQTFEVAEGDNILDIAQSYNLDMEGACGGSCACSTCHVIVDPEFYDEIPEPDDDENDMLDLAFGLTETSRLGCQIKMSKALDGIRIALPAMTRNLQSRDFN